MNLLYRMTKKVAKLDRFAALSTRFGLVVVTLWIGCLKLPYDDTEGVVPVVSDSPFLRWPLKTPDGHEQQRTAQDAFYAASVSWHHANGTYLMSSMLGVMIVAIGVLTAVGIHYPAAGVIGVILLAVMNLVILSLLGTTAELCVPAPGAAPLTGSRSWLLLAVSQRKARPC